MWCCRGAGIVCNSRPAQAQTYTAPPVPSTATAPTTAAAPAGGGFFSTVCANFAATKQKICNGPLGTLLKNALGPLSALDWGPRSQWRGTGQAGYECRRVGWRCRKDQAGPGGSQKTGGSRPFLGTIDCHWYPEAEAGLVAVCGSIGANVSAGRRRAGLARGCCCTKTTMEALAVCVSGSERDGNPAENSLRVQLVAFEALHGVSPPLLNHRRRKHCHARSSRREAKRRPATAWTCRKSSYRATTSGCGVRLMPRWSRMRGA